MGYSTERVVGVWVGNADNEPMLDVSGIDGAGPIWRDIMIAAHHTEPEPFKPSRNIISVSLCAPSGMLPCRYCTQRHVERFIKGSEPTNVDNQFRPIYIDSRTVLPAGVDTEEEFVVERVI